MICDHYGLIEREETAGAYFKKIRVTIPVLQDDSKYLK